MWGLYLLRLAGYYLVWTFAIYILHRAAHHIPILWQFHRYHHMTSYKGQWEFSLWNLVLWFNDWHSTISQWILEVIPTIVLLVVSPEAWPIGLLYYIDGCCLSQGVTTHNPRICLPGLAMGRYHLRHHANLRVNYDQNTHFWDWVFGTMGDPIPKGHFIKVEKTGEDSYMGKILEQDNSVAG